MSSPFAKRVAGNAEDQYNRYHLQHEHDPQLARQIQKYWADLNFSFPGVNTPWSAVFVSWCIKTAGATPADFKFATAHSRFVNWAIKNALNQTGSFRAYEITAYAPGVGDIIHNNRNGHTFDYDYAKTHSAYESHSAIVIETGHDSNGNYLLTVGGNEGDSVGKKLLRLTTRGLIKQRPNSPYICVIQNLM